MKEAKIPLLEKTSSVLSCVWHSERDWIAGRSCLAIWIAIDFRSGKAIHEYISSVGDPYRTTPEEIADELTAQGIWHTSGDAITRLLKHRRLRENSKKGVKQDRGSIEGLQAYCQSISHRIDGDEATTPDDEYSFRCYNIGPSHNPRLPVARR